MFAQIENLFQKYYTVILGLICVIFLAIGVTSVKDDSVVIDEVAHIISGYTALTTFSYPFNIEHPPLVKVIAALPLLFQKITYVLPENGMSDQWEEGHKLLFANANDTDAILFWARFAVLFFHSVLIFICGKLLRNFLSPLWACIAIFFLAFEPNTLAHARYVTTDVGVALLSLITLLLTVLFAKEPSKKYATYLGFSIGAVLITKFSGVLLVAYVFTMLGFFFLFGGYGKAEKKRFLQGIVSAGFISVCIVYGVYTLFNLNTQPGYLKARVEASLMSPTVKQLELALADMPLTRAFPSYFSGLDYAGNRSIQRSEVTGIQFLDGEFKTQGQGWWYYFLKAWVYKESPALILLFLISGGVLCAYFRKQREHERVLSVLLGFAGIYLVISLLSTLNIGIRHIMPILVLLPVVGVIIFSTWEYAYKHLMIGILVLLQVVTVVTSYPFYLSYFNDLSGGSENGYKHLSDSNIDWGQNLKRLTQWAEEQGVDTVYVDYWGKTPLSFYDKKGILKEWHAEWGKPQGIFAIYSMWIEQSIHFKEIGLTQTDYSYLEGLPHKTFGNSIFIYDLK